MNHAPGRPRQWARIAGVVLAGLLAFAGHAQPERLDARVIHNPFGALNPNAGVINDSASDARIKAALARRPKEPPKAAAPPPPPPPPPVAPPLPFTAVGSIAGAQVTGGPPVAFIRQQDRLLLVRAGETIGQNYRVESITEQRIEFTYLPLMQRQTLALAP